MERPRGNRCFAGSSPEALVALLLVGSVTPARADHDTDHTIAQMTAHYHDPGLELAQQPFALLYLRTTEGMRDANARASSPTRRSGTPRSSPRSPTTTWTRTRPGRPGATRDVDPAWRIAFRADPDRLNCTQLIYLGINAHVNNDLAFMIEDMGARYTYPDHKHVDDVLAFRTRPVVYPEIQRDLCPGLFDRVVPPTADRDIFAWRELAWRTASACWRHRPTTSGTGSPREIRQHARDKAREILRWYR